MPTAKELYQDKYIKKLLKIIKCLRTGVCGEVDTCVTPAITLQPSSIEVEVGDDVTLSVIATGTQLTYQWRKDGVNISGETNSTLILNDVDLNDMADYSVVIANVCGILTSATASLTVAEEILTYYVGWRSSETLANSDVEVEGLQQSLPFISGEDLEAYFMSNITPQILLLAEPKTEPIKTFWYGTPYNQGNIGDPDNDLFNYLETTTYRVYYSIYPTQQTQTTILFKIVP